MTISQAGQGHRKWLLVHPSEQAVIVLKGLLVQVDSLVVSPLPGFTQGVLNLPYRHRDSSHQRWLGRSVAQSLGDALGAVGYS